MRKKIIAANWKMYKTPMESLEFLNAFLPKVHDHEKAEIVIFPTATSLSTVIDRVRGTHVRAGAQTMHWLNEGPYTGQTSPTMLTSIGATHVLLGHSERRLYANESYEQVSLKLKAAIAHALTPVLCLGEMLADRQGGFTKDTLMAQMGAALSNLPASSAGTLVVAYEPVWAIGTGSTASPEVANEVHAIIRSELARVFNYEIAENTRILYGGSVKPENSASLLSQSDIDGLLIGGASLDPKSLAKIVHTHI
ncbi:triosephosphate isomerase [Terriglobus roseus DSM 18391]|uniref:Triosephosphate isomerase n=1 Tax=Terriglobus roseus (strain DSM 18391 / NRRL B-41598 / KBS 63) TaxID=926566 RepID=I3ZEP0_TERRK|nr:triose-phosphate isomerase [Terriglobus roseus]AFL87708.1 triosephosphate isomerase [Terriglobus roseus DSM 18391]